MSQYSHPLGDTVKRARNKMGLTQNQVAILTDSDERTIMNIENYKAKVAIQSSLFCSIIWTALPSQRSKTG